jgi:hypothetical protein
MIAEMRIGCWAPVHKTKSLRLYADGDLTGSGGWTARRGLLIWINSTERLISAKKDPGLCIVAVLFRARLLMTVLSLPHSAGLSSAIGDAKAERKRLQPARWC